MFFPWNLKLKRLWKISWKNLLAISKTLTQHLALCCWSFINNRNHSSEITKLVCKGKKQRWGAREGELLLNWKRELRILPKSSFIFLLCALKVTIYCSFCSGGSITVWNVDWNASLHPEKPPLKENRMFLFGESTEGMKWCGTILLTVLVSKMEAKWERSIDTFLQKSVEELKYSVVIQRCSNFGTFSIPGKVMLTVLT